MIAWFRMSEGHELVRSLLIGAPFVLVGDLLVALAVLLDGTGLARQLCVLGLGIASTAAGPGYVIWRLRKLWSEDRYLSLHADGVRYSGAEGKWFESWDDVAGVHLSAAGTPELALNSGATRTLKGRFAGTDGKSLVNTLKNVRRKALFGLYRK